MTITNVNNKIFEIKNENDWANIVSYMDSEIVQIIETTVDTDTEQDFFSAYENMHK